MMFTHHCTGCDRVQLISPEMGHAVRPTAAGPELTFTCWCGSEQTHVLGAEPARRGRVSLIA